MNTSQKKALYESIMKNISKQVKKTLNESTSSENAETYLYDFIQRINAAVGDPQEEAEIKEDVLLVLNSLTEILKPVLLYDFEPDSDEELALDEFDQTIQRIRKML